MKTLLFVLLLSSSISFANRESGGGTLVTTSQGTGLLDLYLYNQTAFFSKIKGPVLRETESLKRFGIDRLANGNVAVLQKALDQLKKWQPSSPVMAEVIARSLKSLPIYYVNYELGYPDQMAFFPAGISVSKNKIQLAALYVPWRGVFVERTSFSALSEKNQMALLIHEALRHDQLTHSSGITSENLQKLTALVLFEPAQGLTLDQPQYLLNRFQPTSELKMLLNDLCEYSEKYCHLQSTPLQAYGKTKSAQLLGFRNQLHKVAEELREARQSLPHGEKRDFIFKLERRVLQATDRLSAKFIDEQYDEARDSLFQLNNAFGLSTIDNAIESYNDRGDYDSSQILKKFVLELKKAGFFL